MSLLIAQAGSKTRWSPVEENQYQCTCRLTAARLFTFGYHLPYSMYREQSQMRVA